MSLELSWDYAAAYAEMHANAKHFQGFSMLDYRQEIAELVRASGATRLLDYGSGKGHQYLVERAHEAWGGILPWCYDPGVRGLATLPGGLCDGVICTDVLEHVAEIDVAPVLAHILGLLEPDRKPSAWAFFAISCRPAKDKKTLPDGRNVHLTVRSPAWWKGRLENAERRWGGNAVIVAQFDS